MRNPCTTIMTFQPHAADFHQALVLIYWAVLTISRLFTLPYFLFHKIFVVITHLPGLICLGSSLVLDSEHLQPRWPPVEQSAPYISMILRKNKGLQTGALWTLLIVQLLAGSFLKKKKQCQTQLAGIPVVLFRWNCWCCEICSVWSGNGFNNVLFLCHV